MSWAPELSAPRPQVWLNYVDVLVTIVSLMEVPGDRGRSKDPKNPPKP